MKHWLMANPKAGRNERGADFWQRHLSAAGITDVQVCTIDDDRWPEQLQSGDHLLVAGGDGSVNYAARLCMRSGAVLGVLPSGTANDFARNLNLPQSPAQLCRLMAEAPLQQVDVAVLSDDQLFLNVAHVGLGTLPSRQAEGESKRWLGRYSYIAQLIRRFRSRRGLKAHLQLDDRALRGRWLTIAVASGAFFGGGSEIPQTCINDGQLTVMAVRARPLWSLIKAFVALRLKRTRTHRGHVVEYHKSQSCQIQCSRPHTFTADGEVMGKTPLTITLKPKALNVIARQLVTTG